MRPPRVLSIPGRHHENRIFRLTAEALEASGVTVVDPGARQVALFHYDILHLNFPTHYITENGPARATVVTLAFAAYLALARLLGRKIVYTVHDVVPFRTRNTLLLWPFLWFVHAVSNAFVFLSASSRAAFVERYPRDRETRWIAIPHGPYPVTPMDPAERARRRAEITGGDAFILGMLGNIKPYKNAAALRAVPRHLADGRPVHLLLAGRAEAGHAAEIQAMEQAMAPGQMTRIDAGLSDAELDRLIQTVDVVLLPYLKGSNSGVAMLVLSNEARLIGSDLPVFAELARELGAPWAYSAGGADLAEAVEAAARDPVTDADRARLRGVLHRASHAEAAAALGRLYQAVRAT